MRDIIIIGGGFAGVSAARACRQAGLSVLLLEANDRLGGRAYSSELNGEAIELGGGYVYWSQPHVWAEINRYGLALKERPMYNAVSSMYKTRFLIDGVLRAVFSDEEKAQISEAFEAYVHPAAEVFPQPYQPFSTDEYLKWDNLTNTDRINQLNVNPLQRAMLYRTAGIQCHNAPTEGGFIEALRWYALANCDPDTYAHSLSRFTLKDGTQHLLQCIWRDAKSSVSLKSPVHKVLQNADYVQVFAGKRVFKAKYCMVATSMNVWKNITFEPEISPERRAFSEAGHAGKGAKIYVEIRGAFPDCRWSAIGEPIISVLPHKITAERSLLVVFTNPEFPFEKMDKHHVELALKRFDPTVQVLNIKFHDWTNDPYFLGTWCSFRPNQFSNYLKMAQSAENRVFFAGSDIASGWRGFIDGAIESGIDCARKILKHIDASQNT